MAQFNTTSNPLLGQHPQLLTPNSSSPKCKVQQPRFLLSLPTPQLSFSPNSLFQFKSLGAAAVAPSFTSSRRRLRWIHARSTPSAPSPTSAVSSSSLRRAFPSSSVESTMRGGVASVSPSPRRLASAPFPSTSTSSSSNCFCQSSAELSPRRGVPAVAAAWPRLQACHRRPRDCSSGVAVSS